MGRESKSPDKGGRFDARGKFLLGGRDVIRTYSQKHHNLRISNIPSYKEGLQLGWDIPVRTILNHIYRCERECPTLLPVLQQFFAMLSEYQLQAA